jgi:hypothetical protein
VGFTDLIATADRAVLGHLGAVPVRYWPEAGDPVDVRGLFTAPYVLTNVSDIGVMNVGPQVFLPAEQVALLGVDPGEDAQRIIVGETEYRVREVVRDGQGGVTLMLTEA